MLNLPYPFSIMFPGAAGNWQAFDARFLSPNISVNYAGNPMIEREVTEDVASYGRQIGWLNDIVATLAAAVPDTIEANAAASESLMSLQDALKKIAKIKERRKADAYDTAAARGAAMSSDDLFRLLLRATDDALAAAHE